MLRADNYTLFPSIKRQTTPHDTSQISKGIELTEQPYPNEQAQLFGCPKK